MGGFSGLAGFGQAAGRFGEEQRTRMLQEWGVRQSALAQLIGQARDASTTPERQTELSGLQSKVLKARPGEDPSKLIDEVMQHLTIHPVAAAAMAPPQPTPKPGPAMPGQTPGQGGLSGLIGGAAQPSTSPVSPAAQSSSYSSQASQAPQAQAPPTAVTPPAAPQPAPPQINPVMGAYQHALDSGSMPPALRTAAQPFLTNQAELERMRAMKEFQLHEVAPQTMEFLRRNVPNWDQLPDFYKASIVTSLAGAQAPSMMGMAGAMYNPLQQTVDAHTLSQQHPGLLEQFHIDPRATPQVRVTYNKIALANGQMVPEMVEAVTPGMGTFTGPNAEQFVAPKTPGPVTGPNGPAVSPAAAMPKTMPMQGGGVGQISPLQMMQGRTPTQIPGAVTPSMLPHSTTSERLVTTAGPNGEPIQTVQPFSSTRTVGTPGGSGGQGTSGSTPHAGREFAKPLTPVQNITESQKLNQYDIAIDRMERLKQKVPTMLASMVDAGKLQLELDSSGFIRPLINRAMSLTPAEAEFVGDFRTMMEDINLVRGAMQAQGFRGPEAWAALQAQRGQLLAHPEVTERVMSNTIAALRGQRDPIAKALGKGGASGAGTAATPTPTHRYNPATGKIEAVQK